MDECLLVVESTQINGCLAELIGIGQSSLRCGGAHWGVAELGVALWDVAELIVCGVAHWDVAYLIGAWRNSLGCSVAHWGVADLTG